MTQLLETECVTASNLELLEEVIPEEQKPGKRATKILDMEVVLEYPGSKWVAFSDDRYALFEIRT